MQHTPFFKPVSMFLLAVIMAILAGDSFAQAADEFRVATGDVKGGSTYVTMFNELSAACGTASKLTQVSTNGSVQNLDMLLDNAVDAAIIQGDLAEYERTVNPDRVAGLRTLFTLHPEEIHFIARADVKKEGGFMGTNIGADSVTFTKLEDLRGRTIGAVGGSVKTGQLLARLTGLAFTVQDMGDNTKLRAALVAKQLDAILVVAGAPSKFVQSLDTNFRLLPVTGEMAAQMSKIRPIYKAATITYNNLSQTVPTVSTQALLLTRTYKSPAMLNRLAVLRACFVRELPTIQDRRGTHAKWQLVNSDDKGTWQWYDGLPATH